MKDHLEISYPKLAIKIMFILAVTAIVIVAIVRDRIVNNLQNQVSVTGQSRLIYKPDTANVTLGVQVDRATQAEEALSQLNGKMNQIIQALQTAGVAESDIQTENYALLPQYDYVNNISTVGGYSANQQLVVKVKGVDVNLNLLSQAIAAATKAGANQVLGITFETSQLENLKQQARIQAIADARVKAKSLALAAGVHLGAIIGWYENSGTQDPTPMPMAKNMAADAGGGAAVAPNTPTGTQEVVMEMNVSFKVK